MKQLFVAWTPFIRRPESMQQFFGYRLYFIRTHFGKKWFKPFEYMVKTVKTIRLLIKHKPDVLWVQVAPTILLYVAFLFKWLVRPRMAIIADCHNSMYRKPWIRFPGAVALLNRCDRVLVHNSLVLKNALRSGVKEERLSVLETKPANLESAAPDPPPAAEEMDTSAAGRETEEALRAGRAAGDGKAGEGGANEGSHEGANEGANAGSSDEDAADEGATDKGAADEDGVMRRIKEGSRPWVLLPCSFDTDEPIDVVAAAARLIPHIRIIITGNPVKYTGPQDLKRLPANVMLTGFLPKKDYNELLRSCDFVMGVTTRDDVQLSVANEAVGAGKPMVISGSALQRELFYSGAVYVDPLDPRSIADGCLTALEKLDELKAGVERLRKERNERWLRQANALCRYRNPAVSG